HRLLLRAGGEWTRDRCTTEKCNELAPPHCRSALKRVLLALSSVTRKFGLNNGLPGCPLWVKSDICTAIGHVRFTPESGHSIGSKRGLLVAMHDKLKIRNQKFSSKAKRSRARLA